MPSPYGMEIVESCLPCKLRAKRSFCDLPPAALQAFEGIKYATAYPRGAVLFVQGQLPRGIFVLCKGSAKLAIDSPSGTTVIVKVAEPGEVLGLSAALSGNPYEVTAETIDPCQVNFVKRDDFLRFLKDDVEACFKVAEQLSEKYYFANKSKSGRNLRFRAMCRNPRDFRNPPCRSNPARLKFKDWDLPRSYSMGHRCILVLLSLALAASAALAQDSDTAPPARKVVQKVAPVYPDLARRMEIYGVVKLRARVDPNGTVRLIEPVGGNPVLLRAAQEAVTNWKYAPAPNETQELIELRFNKR